MLEDGQELLQKPMALGMDVVGMLRQLVLPKSEQLTVEMTAFGKLFQLHIALQQGSVVFQQSVEIQGIKLRYDTVNELSAQVATFINKVAVVGRNHHQGELAYMVAEAIVFLLVETKRFLLVAFLHARHQLVVLAIVRIHAMDGEEILLVKDVLLVSSAKEALAKRKVIDGIEDVGFYDFGTSGLRVFKDLTCLAVPQSRSLVSI